MEDVFDIPAPPSVMIPTSTEEVGTLVDSAVESAAAPVVAEAQDALGWVAWIRDLLDAVLMWAF